ncbi:hypothetical protein EPA93_15355 [Ktedonosporobacter rubrisoli]|uniref:Novel STAND NTPase 1 domain-containing protein n=1 Tax=Ktedonosporobacter rubrisoli TaxID=2509675 RepID=A0A4P6JPV0_KTERU|nr:trypsin-like peptidase domain-containing protein [Ktedonosporobacter rubrisoli]QBD77294.1 hypothetical protein EPA93_15355 [Ktedonosporobacter rubrisoli]
MSEDIKAGIALIQSGQNIGAGFLLSDDGLLVTCAHVLGKVLPSSVKVTFYVLPDCPYTARVLSDLWRSDQEEDIAFLQIESSLPRNVRPLHLGSSQYTSGHRISTFGFPNIESLQGLPASGMMSGETIHATTGHRVLTVEANAIAVGFSGAPIWDEQRRCVIGMVTSITKPDNRARMANVACVLPSEVVQNICPRLHLEDVCPYKGLEPFTEQDAKFFFGRERYIHELIELLLRDKRLLAILGPIGSGKTSVLQAGVLPLLRSGKRIARSDHWEIFLFQQTNDPLFPLRASGLLTSRGQRLIEGVRAWQRNHPQKERLVLIFDQFEKIFTRTKKDLCKEFIQQLVTLIQSDLAVTIILAMSDDRYSELAEHSELIKLVERQLSNIPPMRYEEIMEVIENPAQVVDLHFENGLKEKIAEDSMTTLAEPSDALQKRHSSGLPLLAFLLKHMWDQSPDHYFTHACFEHVGGTAGALTKWATETYQSLTQRQQALARRIFTDLVDLGDDRQGRLDCRIQKTLTGLCHAPQEEEEVRAVVEIFAQAHLLETSLDEKTKNVTVKIIHDVLLREWDLLQTWLREDHQFLSWRREIRHRANKWVQSSPYEVQHRDEGILLRGRDVTEAALWFPHCAHKLTLEEQAFLQASIEWRQQEETRNHQHEETKQLQERTLAQRIATQAQLLQTTQPHLIEQSLLLAVEAIKRFPCIEAEQALRQGVTLLPRLLFRANRRTITRSVLYTRDGNTLVIAGLDGLQWLSGANINDQSIFNLPLGPLQASAVSGDGAYIVVADTYGKAWIVDTQRASILVGLHHPGPIHAVAVTNQPSLLFATASKEKTARIWSITDVLPNNDASSVSPSYLDKSIHCFSHPGVVRSVTFSSDGRYVATANADHTARIWDISNGKQVAVFSHDALVNTVAFSPDDTYIATASEDKTVRLWKWPLDITWGWRRKPKPEYIFRHNGAVHVLSFSFDGKYIATGSEDKTARVYDLKEGYEAQRFPHQAPVTAVCFHPHEYILATASQDHLARIWRLDQEIPVHYLPHRGPVRNVLFHPHKPYIVTAGDDGHVHIWQIGQWSQIMSRPYNQGKVRGLLVDAFKGRQVLHVAVEGDNRIQHWKMCHDHDAQQPIQEAEAANVLFNTYRERLVLTDSPVSILSDDHRYCAAAGPDGTITIKNFETAQETRIFLPGETITALALSASKRFLAIATRTGIVHIREWEHERGLHLTLPMQEQVHTLLFSAQDDYLVTANDHQIALWCWQTMKEQPAYTLPHQETLSSLTLSPDKKYLLTTCTDEKARLWDLTTGLLINEMQHTKAVQLGIFSSDGTYLATASTDQTVSIWETSTGEKRACLLHSAITYAMRFSKDDAYLATASEDNIIRLWLWKPEDLIAEARLHLSRNLTQEEWQASLGNEPYRKTYTDLAWREF